MHIALLQLNPTVGDFEGNANQVVAGLRQAQQAGADLAVCSELVVTGYPPRDLLDRPRFIQAAAECTRRIVEQTRDVPLVFGGIGATSGHLTNDAIVAADGRERCRSSKVLLPSYDVFDELRHFTPGARLGRFEHAGRRIVLSVCEDAWASDPSVGGRYDNDPFADVGTHNTDLIVNLSASPFTLAKLRQRDELFAGVARRRGVPLCMVNQVGGNDELLFDGRSALFDAQGRVVARAKAFEEDLLVCPLEAAPATETPLLDEEAAYRGLVMGVRDYSRKCGFDRAVLGLSGGVDSALVATIAVDALGSKNVLGVAMPTRYSSEHSLADARELARNLGVRFEVIDVDPMFQSYIAQLGPQLDGLAPPGPSDVTWENVQARIRGATIMAISNRTGALPLSTGNKSELAVGYCTLYGDMVGGLSVISDVPKTMVYRIANWVNRDNVRIPTNTITKPPSAELRPDQKDEDSLPPYGQLDAVLEGYVEQHQSVEELVARGFQPDVVQRVIGLIRGAEYKRRQAAPGLILTKKAFGSGRRVPIAQRYVDLPDNAGNS